MVARMIRAFAERKARAALLAAVERVLDRVEGRLEGSSHRWNVLNTGYWLEVTPYKRAGVRAARRYAQRTLKTGR